MLYLVTLLPFLASAQAFFILTQPILATTRLDPIVDPGTVSGHVHTIAGGSNFDKSMTYESARASGCTTAPITVDKSNYWIPSLYYYEPVQKTYQAIPAAYVNTYYLNRYGKNDTIHAFPDGLRMISGDPSRRIFNKTDVDDQAISYVCLDYSNSHQGDPAWAQRNNFFNHNCPDGMRAQINFPTCWNGKDLDSPDHRSHMAWPTNGNNNGGGDCPASHPVKVVELFYEFIFEVQKFPFNAAGTPTWVWANGDASGYGLHGDFLNGWPALVNGTNVLQQAIDHCDFNNGVGGNLELCPPFAGLINRAAADGCQPQNPLVNEDVGLGHSIARLPGNNPLWTGSMTDKPSYDNYTEADPTYTDFRSVIPPNWSAVGCIAEAVNGRALEGYSFSAPNMTRGMCAAECGRRGFPLSGSQFGIECYCDFTLKHGATNTSLSAEKCNTKCGGNIYENCGGSRTLNVYANPLLVPVAFNATSVGNPTSPAGVDGWFRKARNCVAEPADTRALTGFSMSTGTMTPAVCMSLCAARGFTFAGTQWSSECYCGSSVSAGSTEAATTECNMACSGKSDEMCGGSRRLNMYYYNATAAAPKVLPPNWVATGCWNAQATSGRAFAGPLTSNSSITNDVCMLECQSKGFALAGIEYGSECRCAQEFAAGSVQVPASECSMTCAGNPLQACGAGYRMTTFKYTGTIAAPVVPNNANVTVAGWTNRGCYTEEDGGRTLPKYSFSSSSMTIPTCLAGCAARGYRFGGVEYGQECFCSDAIATVAKVATDGCTMVCPGDKMTLCGGANRLNIFENTTPAVTSTSATTTAASTASPAPSSWAYRGCFSETNGNRAVQGSYKTSGDMNRTSCMAFARANSHTFAALVYGRECFTGLALSTNSNATAEAECDFNCVGAPSEKCGGGGRASVFQLAPDGARIAVAAPAATTSSTTAAVATTSPKPVTTAAAANTTTVAVLSTTKVVAPTTAAANTTIATSPTTTIAATTSSTTTAAATSSAVAAPTGYIGCFTDRGQRQLNGTAPFGDQKVMTNNYCVDYCAQRGFAIAGTTYGAECMCGNYINRSDNVTTSDPKGCGMACAASSAQKCGAAWQISAYLTGSGKATYYDQVVKRSYLPRGMGRR